MGRKLGICSFKNNYCLQTDFARSCSYFIFHLSIVYTHPILRLLKINTKSRSVTEFLTDVIRILELTERTSFHIQSYGNELVAPAPRNASLSKSDRHCTRLQRDSPTLAYLVKSVTPETAYIAVS